ncbi:HAMP domain-containing protein [Dactylosporangium sp. NPDC000521]|uniref:HAMP domain-containing protein n=1 Tax=Dactylosporangium sp. NPDC000521 TaxID=3363975 RepID=UPI0036B33D2F
MGGATGGLIRRMVLATCVLLVFVGGAFATLLVSIGEHRETARVSRQSHALFAAADEVNRQTIELRAAQESYALSGDGQFLARWQAAHTAVVDANQRLEGLAVTETQRKQTRQIARTSTAFADEVSRPAVEAAQRGDAAARAAPVLLEGDRRIAQLHADLDALRTTEADAIRASDAKAETTASREMVAIIVGIAGSALIIALVGFYQTRLLVQPIRRAAAMADRLAGGDLGARMPEAGKAEIGRLERSFNVMAEALQHSVGTQSALRRVATLVARGGTPDEVLAAVVEELGRLVGSGAARIVRFEADGTATVMAAWGRPDPEVPIGTRVSLEGDTATGVVQRTGRTAQMKSFEGATAPLAVHARELGAHASISAPINVAGRLWGAVTVFALGDQQMLPDAEERLAAATDLIGTAVANAQAHDDLAASRTRVVLATDEARRRIERNLHDGVQQRLLSLGLDVRRIQHTVSAGLPELRAELAEVAEGINGTVDDIREISRGVHPAILTEGGLRPALKALARRSAVPVDLDLDLADRLPAPMEVAAYYVVAEALANAAKHARATRIEVRGAVRDDRLDLTVRDDGVGGADPDRGSGLVGLADRVEALGGTIRVDSPAGGGTLVRVVLPLLHT